MNEFHFASNAPNSIGFGLNLMLHSKNVPHWKKKRKEKEKKKKKKKTLIWTWKAIKLCEDFI